LVLDGLFDGLSKTAASREKSSIIQIGGKMVNEGRATYRTALGRIVPINDRYRTISGMTSSLISEKFQYDRVSRDGSIKGKVRKDEKQASLPLSLSFALAYLFTVFIYQLATARSHS